MEIKYVVKKVESDLYHLYSVVNTDFGGDAHNYICSGSKDYCEGVKIKLLGMEKKDGM